jgi:hypothetical protein
MGRSAKYKAKEKASAHQHASQEAVLLLHAITL